MAGIYIHIPFCKTKCHYCNFFSLATNKYRDDFNQALLIELIARKNELSAYSIDSIYFGGGTPSLLSVSDLQKILDLIQSHYQLSPTAEITLEANPDDLNKKYLQGLKSTLINRLSIGIQSFNNDELRFLNRVHSAQEAIDSVNIAQDVGFDNISLDLIYGIPNSSIFSWEKNLDLIKSFNTSHLSAYSLTQENKTTYDVLIKKGRLQAPDDTKAVQQYKLLQKMLGALKLEQYEISNYAMDQRYALHNTNYWRGIPYMGLGPSAHSYSGEKRRWNIAHLAKYIESTKQGKTIFEEEILSINDKWNEKIMTALRTQWGVDLKDLQRFNREKWKKDFLKKAKEFIDKELMLENDGNYILSNKGKLFADGIAGEFFV